MSARYTSILVFADLQRQLNRLFEQTAEIHRGTLQKPGWAPNIDIVELPDRFVVLAEVPGIAADDLEVSFCGELLTVRGTKTARLPEGVQGTFRCVERERGEFERRLRIGPRIDVQAASTHLVDGLLRIELPKRDERRDAVHRIPIHTSEGPER